MKYVIDPHFSERIYDMFLSPESKIYSMPMAVMSMKQFEPRKLKVVGHTIPIFVKIRLIK